MLHLTIAAVSLCLATAAFADPADTKLPPGSAPGNLWKVSDGVFRGARVETPEEMDYLVNTLHVKTIINLQGGDDKSPRLGHLVDHFEKGETDADIDAEKASALATSVAAGQAPVNYYSRPLNSLGKITPDESDRIKEILAIMNDPSKQPVYVHCAHGADRTGLVVALYRVANKQLSPLAAYEEMLTHGHNLVHVAFTSYMDRGFFKGALKIVLNREMDSLEKQLGDEPVAAEQVPVEGAPAASGPAT